MFFMIIQMNHESASIYSTDIIPDIHSVFYLHKIFLDTEFLGVFFVSLRLFGK